MFTKVFDRRPLSHSKIFLFTRVKKNYKFSDRKEKIYNNLDIKKRSFSVVDDNIEARNMKRVSIIVNNRIKLEQYRNK